jgi:hypothetical protein
VAVVVLQYQPKRKALVAQVVVAMEHIVVQIQELLIQVAVAVEIILVLVVLEVQAL